MSFQLKWFSYPLFGYAVYSLIYGAVGFFSLVGGPDLSTAFAVYILLYGGFKALIAAGIGFLVHRAFKNDSLKLSQTQEPEEKP